MSEQGLPPSAEVIEAETSVVAAEVAAEKAETEIDSNVRIRKVGKALTVLTLVIVSTWLSTGYVIFKHGSFMFGGDSIEGLRKQIQSAETNAGKRYENILSESAKFRRTRDEVEGELRDQIDKLNAELEKEQKQKRILRVDLRKTKIELTETQGLNVKLIQTREAERMLNEAHHTIAMNVTPLNLQEYFDLATDLQWTAYTQMAVDRNAWNVVDTIASLPRLMKINEVKLLVDKYRASYIGGVPPNSKAIPENE